MSDGFLGELGALLVGQPDVHAIAANNFNMNKVRSESKQSDDDTVVIAVPFAANDAATTEDTDKDDDDTDGILGPYFDLGRINHSAERPKRRIDWLIVDRATLNTGRTLSVFAHFRSAAERARLRALSSHGADQTYLAAVDHLARAKNAQCNNGCIPVQVQAR